MNVTGQYWLAEMRGWSEAYRIKYWGSCEGSCVPTAGLLNSGLLFCWLPIGLYSSDLKGEVLFDGI